MIFAASHACRSNTPEKRTDGRPDDARPAGGAAPARHEGTGREQARALGATAAATEPLVGQAHAVFRVVDGRVQPLTADAPAVLLSEHAEAELSSAEWCAARLRPSPPGSTR